jgi:hypothetical protein
MHDRDYEIVAQHVSDLMERMSAMEKVQGRLEAAALTTARALQEISRHWDAVYEAMRREQERDVLAEDVRREQHGAHPRAGD